MKSVDIEMPVSGKTVTMRGPRVSEWKEFRKGAAKLSGLAGASIDSEEADVLTDPEVLALVASLTGLSTEEIDNLDLEDYLPLVNGLVEVSPDFADKRTS